MALVSLHGSPCPASKGFVVMAAKNTRAHVACILIILVLADSLGSNWLLRKPMAIKPC